MRSKSYCNRRELGRGTRTMRKANWIAAALCVCWAFAPQCVQGADAPQWMHALVNAPLPPHDEKTDAVLLYYEEILNVQSNGKIKTIERRAYKILRPGGREHGTVYASYDAETKITGIRGWCIPAQGKDYEVKD